MPDHACNHVLVLVADLAEFVRLAHPEQAMQEAATDACIAISGLVEELNTHLGIYTALKNSVEKGDLKPETEVDKHVAKLFLQDFQQCGIHLPEHGRRQVKKQHWHCFVQNVKNRWWN